MNGKKEKKFMKKLRLLLFEECERDCGGCCNKQWDLANVPVVENFLGYDEILLTGGEPLLRPEVVKQIIPIIRANTLAPIYLYTAKSDNIPLFVEMFRLMDGITLTLHEPSDVASFCILNSVLRSFGRSGKSLRLNVFNGIDLSGIDLSIWKVKDNLDWINPCPLPVGEVLRRLRKGVYGP
jgi:hypothetical protein